jgi:endo-1,4-beta-xylanase
VINRRNALCLGLGTLAGVVMPSSKLLSQIAAIAQNESLFRTFPVANQSSLMERAKAKGLDYGSAILHHHLNSNAEYADSILRECNMIVPEWEFKWSAGARPLRPAPHRFDFTLADESTAFANDHNLLLRGHTLVWHLSLPSWFSETVNSQNADAYLTEHIQTVVGRYAGQIHSWDVVNEAIDLQDGRSDGLRRTPWLEFLGTDYIKRAFQIAAAADPNALLVYNDYGFEYDKLEDEAKRTAVLKLLERLKSQGTPIHAFGIQSHLDGSETRLNPRKLRQFLADVADLGLKILVTELDVTDKDLAANSTVRDRVVAAAYEDYLNMVLDEPAVIAVVTWGLSDRYTWLSEFQPRQDRLPVRPLPLDENMNRKLAWNAIARSLDQAIARGMQP